jgi:hypothetical protein
LTNLTAVAMDRHEFRPGMQIVIHNSVFVRRPAIDFPAIGIVEEIMPCISESLAHLNHISVSIGGDKHIAIDDNLAKVSERYNSHNMPMVSLKEEDVREGMWVRRLDWTDGIGTIVRHDGELINNRNHPPMVYVKFPRKKEVVFIYNLLIVPNTYGKNSEESRDKWSQNTQAEDTISEGHIVKVQRPLTIIHRGQRTGGLEVRSKRKGATIRG